MIRKHTAIVLTTPILHTIQGLRTCNTWTPRPEWTGINTFLIDKYRAVEGVKGPWDLVLYALEDGGSVRRDAGLCVAHVYVEYQALQTSKPDNTRTHILVQKRTTQTMSASGCAAHCN